MAKKKKPSGTDLGVGLLVQAFWRGLAWGQRFITNLIKTIKWFYQNTPIANTKFDTWCVANFGAAMPLYVKIGIIILILFLFGQFLIPLFIIFLILKSF